MHIVSNVEGKVASDKTAFEALMAGFPAGTVSGGPKIRAMQIIDELENTKKGNLCWWYWLYYTGWRNGYLYCFKDRNNFKQ